MQYNSLLTRIAADIYSNGAELITGDVLQNVLNEMVGALASAGACYKGTITPASAAPLDLDQPTVYLALTAGTYTNFVDSNNDPIVTTGPALITYDGGASLVFTKTDLPFATTGDLSNYLELDGGTMEGAIDMDGNAIQNVPDPVNNGDAANKGYVDRKQPWKVTIEPDADSAYILIRLGEPSHSCILAIDSASGAGALHGILCIDENFDITGAVFAGSGGLDTTVDAKSGYDDNSPRNYIAVLKFRNDQPVTLTCIGGNAPQLARAFDAIGGETFTSTRAWTNLEAGGDEQTSNKKTDIPANRTSETYYPNTKGVFDLTSKWGVISQTQTWTRQADNSYAYAMSDLVYGAIPQANIDLFTAAGAEFDTATGYFKLNGLTDISYEEMMQIYRSSSSSFVRNIDLSGRFNNYTGRTLFPFKEPQNPASFPTKINGTFWKSSIEAIAFELVSEHSGFCPDSSMQNFLNDATKCKKILGNINVYAFTSGTPFSSSFSHAYSLETINLMNLKVSIPFPDSPRLSMTSLAYMINKAGTATITITLHATAYAAAQSDAGVQAALSSKTNVSLASA